MGEKLKVHRTCACRGRVKVAGTQKEVRTYDLSRLTEGGRNAESTQNMCVSWTNEGGRNAESTRNIWAVAGKINTNMPTNMTTPEQT